jgi:hypothetical protein
MPIVVESDKDVIVYAFGMIIAYARDNQDILLAQTVWWISSIIGLQQGLVMHIDNIKKRSDITIRESVQEDNASSNKIHHGTIVSRIAGDNQDGLSHDCDNDNIHPDRISQVGQTILDLSNGGPRDVEPSQEPGVVGKTEQLLKTSRKARRVFTKQKRINSLSRTWSGRIIAKPLSNEQRNYLQAIPKDTIATYLEDRK